MLDTAELRAMHDVAERLTFAQSWAHLMAQQAQKGRDPRWHTPYPTLGTPRRKHRGNHTQHAQGTSRLLRGRFQ